MLKACNGAAQQHPNPVSANSTFANAFSQTTANQHPLSPRQAPLAWLIENPDQTDGTPPYALTDQNGAVQRYVEPVPGIDLAAYVGQIVSVRNDSGPTLLASQLDLPRQPLRPLVGEAMGRANRGGLSPIVPNRTADYSGIIQTQFVDNDDSTVQLLPDDVPMPDAQAVGAGEMQPLEMLGGGPEYGYPGQLAPCPTCSPGCNPQFCEPMPYGPGMMQPYPAPYVGPCPQCGGYDGGVGCAQNSFDTALSGVDSQRTQVYADVDFNFFRTHLSEDVVGKLSETYELSPRYILGVQNLGNSNLGARIRYWHYGRTTNVLGNSNIRLKLDVLDIEGVHCFAGRNSQLDVSAGIRLADFKIRDTAGDKSSSDMLGLTMAADGLTTCNLFSVGYLGWAYGGRVSILGGDWGGDSDFVDHHVSDDNILVTELYAGGQFGRRFGNVDLHGRVVFEIQNWRSDVLAQDGAIESISFLGPALQIGAEF